MIDILLAVYNGESYLRQQLDSLFAQDYGDIHIIAGDDCSTDSSCSIIIEYMERYPGRIELVRSSGNMGPMNNFFNLLAKSSGDYVMFCDQDDYWLENKVSLSLEGMQRAEEEYGGDMPILLHTDMKVVDKELNVVADSFFAYQHLDSSCDGIENLMVQNIVTGCTMMINRPLMRLLYHVPVRAPLHDWWIGLLAASCGKIVFLDKPTLLYRNHGDNYCGPKDMSSPAYVLNRLKGGERNRLMLRYGYRQAEEMSRIYKARVLGRENYVLLRGYGRLEEKPYIERLAYVLTKGILKSGFIRRVGQFIYL